MLCVSAMYDVSVSVAFQFVLWMCYLVVCCVFFTVGYV